MNHKKVFRNAIDILIAIMYVIFGFLVYRAITIYDGNTCRELVEGDTLFITLRVIFYILALGLPLYWIKQFLEKVNKMNLVSLIISAFPILFAIVYIIITCTLHGFNG